MIIENQRVSYGSIILFLLFNFTTPLLAQTDFAIDPTNLNSRYLTFLIKEGIDSVRKTKNLTPLHFDVRLESAAQDQAIHLLSNPKAGHFQRLKNKRRVSDRIILYGGSFKKSGENIMQTYLIEPISSYKHIKNYDYRNQSYRQTARNIVASWVSSPPHYKNLLQPGYHFTGVALGFDSINNILQVVQVFSDQGNSDDFEFVSEPVAFHYQKYNLDAKLKPAANNRNLTQGKKWLYNSSYPSWIVTTRRSVKQAFRWYHFRTRLLIENTTLAQFEDEEKYQSRASRLNQRDTRLDSLHYWVKRKEMMRLLNEIPAENLVIGRIVTPIKIRPRNAYIKIPGHWSESSTMRLVMVRKGRICAIVPYGPHISKRLSPKFPKLPLLLPKFGMPADTTINYKPDSAYYEVYYDRNESALNEEDQLALLELVPVNSKVKKIKILAHASIEGTQAANERLFQTRADQILNFLAANDVLQSGATLQLETRENWSLMEEQLLTIPELFNANGKSPQAIRDYINQHANDSIVMTCLQQQRFARVFYEVEYEQRKYETPDETLFLFNEVLAKERLDKKEVNKALSLQQKYYHLLAELHIETTNDLHVPEGTSLTLLRYQEVAFIAGYSNWSDEQIHSMMVSTANLHGLPASNRFQCVRNHQIYLANEIFHHGDSSLLDDDWNCPVERTAKLNLRTPQDHNHYQKLTPPYLATLDLIPELVQMYQKHGQYLAMTQQMNLYYLVMKAQTLLDLKDYHKLPAVQALSKQVWIHHVKSRSLSEEETIDYALFFSLTYQKDFAVELLQPLAERPNPNPYAWMIWMSLTKDQKSERQLEREVLLATSWMPNNLWLELVESDRYLPLTLLERPQLRKICQEYIRASKLSEK